MKKKINWRDIKLYPECSYILKGKQTIYEYCMGGKAIVVLVSPTGISHSYYISKPWMEDKEEFVDDLRFVYTLSNKQRWVYLGELCNKGKLFRKTLNSRYSTTSEEFKGMMYITKMMNNDFNTPMKLYHGGCCSRCGRKLTDSSSILRGVGPKCRNKV